MLNLLRKELTLTMHPSTIIFIALSAMLLIPNYPYLVVFFYTAMAVFFNNNYARENSDTLFTLMLPVSKRDMVKSRIVFSVLLEMASMILCVLFAILRQSMGEPNYAGMDANIALFGFAFIMLGLFNFTFYSVYFKDVKRVGVSFLWSCLVMLLYVAAEMACNFTVPFVRDVLDTPDSVNIAPKLAVLAIGAAIYALLTLAVYKKSVKNFERYDV